MLGVLSVLLSVLLDPSPVFNVHFKRTFKLAVQDDRLTKVGPLLAMIPDWKDFLSLSSEEELDTLRKHERSGRPLGEGSFVERLEDNLDRIISPQKRGPKPRNS